MWSMPAWRFLLLAPRLEAYSGAVAARRSAQQRQEQRERPRPVPAEGRQQVRTQTALPIPAGARVIGATAAEIGMSDIGDLFSHGSSGG